VTLRDSTVDASWSRSRGRCRRRRAGTTGAHNCIAAPDRSVVLEHDQRGPLFLTRCGSHHELVPDCQSNPTRNVLPAPELARDRAPRGAGLRLISSSHPEARPREVDRADPSTDRRATRPFCILMRIHKSTGNLVALSELVLRGRDRPCGFGRHPDRTLGSRCWWGAALSSGTSANVTRRSSPTPRRSSQTRPGRGPDLGRHALPKPLGEQILGPGRRPFGRLRGPRLVTD
jgi:hypothetical protein